MLHSFVYLLTCTLFSQEYLGFFLRTPAPQNIHYWTCGTCMVLKKKKKKIEKQAEKHLAVNQSDSNIYFFSL